MRTAYRAGNIAKAARENARTSSAMLSAEEAVTTAVSLCSRPISSHSSRDVVGLSLPEYT